MNILFKYSMLFVSYAPLWVSIVFIDSMSLLVDQTKNPWTERISLVCIIIILLISLINVYVTLRSISKENSSFCIIRDVNEEKSLTLEYLLSFILPMLIFDFTLWRQVVLFLIYFLTLAALCLKHNLITANVVIELAGYKFYCVRAEDGNEKSIEREVVSRSNLLNNINEKLYLIPINDNLYYDVTNKKGEAVATKT